MKIHRLSITNFRCFPEVDIPLGNITVLTGQNNSGKSSILRAVLLAQVGFQGTPADVRVGETEAEIMLECTDVGNTAKGLLSGLVDGSIGISVFTNSERSGLTAFSVSMNANGRGHDIGQFSNIEPRHCLIPYLSKRKVISYSEDVRAQHARTVTDMTYLAAKLARITNATYPGHDLYRESCEKILGFMLTAVPSENGQRPGIYLPDGTALTLSEMGEGVPNIAALLIELATADGKIFVIEEPENDLHPASLKALLDMILTSAARNQFIISTHSNIVVQYLGHLENGLYYVERIEQRPPTSSIRPVASTAPARLEILRELGYSLSDFELWEGWLILEESSAEKIIRDFLIPYFVPGLAKIRTFAANGTNDVEVAFQDFHRLVRFTHLEAIYRSRTWVKVDGDEAGKSVINKLAEAYATWDQGHFSQFSQPQFEYYYPAPFRQRISEVFAIKARADRRAAKRQLLTEVVAWLKEDRSRAIAALQDSAAEVIEYLRVIDREIEKK